MLHLLQQKAGAPSRCTFNRPKEIKMFTNRFTKIVVATIVIAVALVTASMLPAGSTSVRIVESKEQALREYQLGERYGVLPQNIALFSADQIHRDYILGEKYGVTPQEYAREQALREYWLGERYGQAPQDFVLATSVEVSNALTANHLGEKVIVDNALEAAPLTYRQGEKESYATVSNIDAALSAYHLGEKEVVNMAESAWMLYHLGEKDIK
jgi:hypothetical protein